jgi:hypothetical protein
MYLTKSNRSLVKKTDISWGEPANKFFKKLGFQFLETDVKTVLFEFIEFLEIVL